MMQAIFISIGARHTPFALTQSMIYLHFLVARFQENVLLIVHYQNTRHHAVLVSSLNPVG